jgi:para-aminobenzoate synthetase component 1
MSEPESADPYRALLDCDGPCALLESTTPASPLSRRSLLARDPWAVLVADEDGVRGAGQLPADPLLALRALLARTPAGGAVVGALSYDFARPAQRRTPGLPLLIALAVERLQSFEAPAELPGRGPAPPGPRLDLAAHSSLTRDAYLDRVARAQEHIAAGDIYQANLSQRFRLPFPHSGLRLYEPLRRISPAPFAGYLRAAGLEIVSASPERLLLVEGGSAVTRPIAGTRPRSADHAHDRELHAELLLSPKERAEHLMLVDLARNDLGQVARIGSVEVDELMVVEEYAQVRHIVSNVRARLAPGRDAIDALLALFPGGTITGVPKRRCMEILDELEPVPRGFYTGALFYATPEGRLDANILIRSAVVREGTLTFSAGGGIVADSIGEREYEETLHKAEGLRLAAQAVLGGNGTNPAPSP